MYAFLPPIFFDDTLVFFLNFVSIYAIDGRI